MDTNTAFIEAAKRKLRFPVKGQATTEDLFDLTREQLDALYQDISAAQKLNDGESLIQRRTADAETETRILQLTVIKAVFDIKSEAANEARKVAEKKKRNERIMEIIATKQDAELANKSMDELKALLEK